MSHHTSRGQVAIVAALMLMLALVSCGPAGPIAGPTPTPSASEDPVEIAIREAKQTYLNYVDAVGQIDTADQASIDAVLELVRGEQLITDTQMYQGAKDLGWTITGGPTVTLLEVAVGASSSIVLLHTCVDVSEFRFFDETGQERVSSGKDPIEAIDASVVMDADGVWRVDLLSPRVGEPSCSD